MDYLELFGNIRPTLKGDELKGWSDGCSFYLNASDCREAARQLVEAAELLEKNPKEQEACSACSGTGMTVGWSPSYADPDNIGGAESAEPCPVCNGAKTIS